MRAVDVCREAADLVETDRAQEYGDAQEMHRKIALLWSAWLEKTVTGHDVAIMMALMKAARTKSSGKDDNYIDMAGYAGLASQVRDDAS